MFFKYIYIYSTNRGTDWNVESTKCFIFWLHLVRLLLAIKS